MSTRLSFAFGALALSLVSAAVNAGPYRVIEPSPGVTVTADNQTPPPASEAAVAYDYTGSGTGGLYDTVRPAAAADIGTLSTPIGAGQGFQITAATVARVQGGTAANAGSFDVWLLIFDNSNAGAPSGSTMSNVIGAAQFNRTSTSTLSVLTTGITFSTPLPVLTSANFGYAMLYTVAGSAVSVAPNGTVSYTPNTFGTTAFYQDRAATLLGSSTNGFYEDTNLNGQFEGTEFTGFAAPNDVKSNVYFQLTGNVITVPEPASLTAIASTALLAFRRRRAV